MSIPAGTRFEAAYDAATGTTAPVTLDAEHFTLAAGSLEVALTAASLPAAAGYAGKTLPVVRIPRALREVTEADFTDATAGAPTEYGLPSRSVKVETDGAGKGVRMRQAARTTCWKCPRAASCHFRRTGLQTLPSRLPKVRA